MFQVVTLSCLVPYVTEYFTQTSASPSTKEHTQIKQGLSAHNKAAKCHFFEKVWKLVKPLVVTSYLKHSKILTSNAVMGTYAVWTHKQLGVLGAQTTAYNYVHCTMDSYAVRSAKKSIWTAYRSLSHWQLDRATYKSIPYLDSLYAVCLDAYLSRLHMCPRQPHAADSISNVSVM